MKILAIRGANLASLAGEFEIDLASGPLGHVGLFAITGPTGAGKSTLLDALCLALFNKTPRLGNRGGVVIGAEGESGLNDSDPRSLLRRGAAAGHAEVDFVGVDGRRYRARWSVRRARQRTDGTIQNEELMLRGLDDPLFLVAGKKSEVSEAISAKLGLTFEQFKQSVLLAQGDFAAFLKADGKERAQLLERMTGTEIYGRLSIMAAQKAQDAGKAVAAHREAMAGFQPLAPEERQKLESKLAELSAGVSAQGGLVKELEAGQRWFAELAEKISKVEEAERQAEAARIAWEEARPRRTRLEAVRAAQPLRAELDAADKAAANLKTCEKALEGCRAELDEATVEAEQASKALELADQHLSRALAAQEEARPALDEARLLDTQVREAGEKVRQASAEAESQAAVASRAQQDATSLERALAASRGRRDDAAAWLARHPEIGPLASEWSRWRQEFQRYATARGEIARLERERPGLARSLATAREAHEAARSAAEAAEQAKERARQAADAAAKAAAVFDLDAIALDRATLTDRGERLSGLERVRALGDLARQQALDRRQAQTAYLEEARQAGVSAEEALARRAPLIATLEEAERAARNLAAARDLSSHRAALVDGEPCPLCGATAHPWASGEKSLDDLAARQEARVKELRDALTELDATVKAQEERARQARAGAETAADEATRHEAEAARQQAAWQELVAGLEPDFGTRLPASFDDLRSALQLEALKAELKGALQDLDTLQKRAQQAHAAAKEAASAYQTALEESASANREASRAEKALDAAGRNLEELDRRAAEARQRCSEAQATLAGAFPGGSAWQEGLEADHAAFFEKCRAQVEEWEAHLAARDEAAAEVVDLEPRHAAAVANARALAEAASRARAEAARAASHLEDRQAARRRLLGGQDTAAFEAALRKAVEEATRTRQAAATRNERAGQVLAAARASVTHAENAREAAVREADGASRALERVLEGAGMDLETLRQHLSRDRAWIAAEEAAIESLATALTQAQQSREILAAQRTEHERAGRPRWPESEILPALEAARAELARLQGEAISTEALLKADDRNRVQAEKAAEVLADLQKAADLWGQLAAVIGSKDGNKFRRFAQSLTLEALLALANEHLRDLAPRYRLMRVPYSGREQHALELQVVDLDMGDEIRSANTLSGGESFLVSLALALGLSSLAARNTKIDSLFIDEGFGTLDPATLEVALATLDALQAEGRQVGLISHVPGLGERIGAQVKVVPRGSGRSTVEIRTDVPPPVREAVFAS